MFWKRRNDGFEWKEYVRTTVLVRREERRKKLEALGAAAVEGVKEAGRKGAKLSAAGAASGISGAGQAARTASSGLATAVATAWDWTVVAASATWLWLADRMAPVVAVLLDALRLPLVALLLTLVSLFAGVSAIARYTSSGLDGQALLAGVVALSGLLLLVIAHLPALGLSRRLNLGRFAFPRSEAPGDAATQALSLAATLSVGMMLVAWIGPALLAGATGTVDAPTVPASTTTGSILQASGGTVEGRPTVLAGDRLKVGGTTVKLYGVEAPEAGQECAGTKSCAAVAKAALTKLTQGKRVACSISGRTDDGTSSARCTVESADLAAQLVRSGALFAETGLFATYAAQEREARNANLGVWRNNTERPAEHRTKAWEEAKGDAPNGCPIKGVVSGDAKTYVLPWSPSYERTKVRTNRGERWFCSESEARQAGWKPAAAAL